MHANRDGTHFNWCKYASLSYKYEHNFKSIYTYTRIHIHAHTHTCNTHVYIWGTWFRNMICRHLGALFTHLKQRCWQAKIGVCNNGKWQSMENFNSLILDVVCRCFGILIARVGWLPELAGALEVWGLPLGLENVLGSWSMVSSLCSIWHRRFTSFISFCLRSEGDGSGSRSCTQKTHASWVSKGRFSF